MESELSGRRWPIIFIFALYSLSSSLQLIEFSIVPSIFQVYYSVGFPEIVWTSQIFMATFIPLVFPAMMLINSSGLRSVALLGSGINAAGAIIKCFGLAESGWTIVFVGQTVSACAQCFILELPPKIASIWFPSNEMSRATSIGVLGNSVGWLLGFLIPPLILLGPRQSYDGVEKVGSNETHHGSSYPLNWKSSDYPIETVEAATLEVRNQIQLLYLIIASISSVLFLLVLLVFKDKPEKPANRASIKRNETSKFIAQKSSKVDSNIRDYMNSMTSLIKDVPFILLTLSYGLNVGVYYAFSALLNRLIKPTFMENTLNYDDEFLSSLDQKIGLMGSLMVGVGLIGSISGGVILDLFKKYKLLISLVYISALVFLVFFTFMISFGNLYLDFFFISALGFFMTGYLPIGFEFAAEITFPISEASSSGILNCFAQIFGLVITEICTHIISCFSPYGCIDGSSDNGTITWETTTVAGRHANITMIICLSIGTIMTLLIKEDLKRQRAENDMSLTSSNTLITAESYKQILK